MSVSSLRTRLAAYVTSSLAPVRVAVCRVEGLRAGLHAVRQLTLVERVAVFSLPGAASYAQGACRWEP